MQANYLFSGIFKSVAMQFEAVIESSDNCPATNIHFNFQSNFQIRNWCGSQIWLIVIIRARTCCYRKRALALNIIRPDRYKVHIIDQKINSYDYKVIRF